MIYAVTSKKGGCGRSTIALLLTMLTQSRIKGQIVLADFSYGNDLMSILKLTDRYPSLDNLISAIALEMDLDFNKNLVDTNGFFLLPGTRVKQTRYLEKRYSEVVYILKELETKFNSVIIDVDFTLYEELIDSGLEITPFHVLDQNMLNIEKYQEEIQKQIFDGFYIVNRYNRDVFPSLDLFEKNFKKGSIVCVTEDDNLTSVLNKKKIALSVIKSSPTCSGLNKLSAIVSNNLTVTDLVFNGNRKKKTKSPFSGFFKMKSATVESVNSLEGLVREKKVDNVDASTKVKKVKGKKKGRKGDVIDD